MYSAHWQHLCGFAESCDELLVNAYENGTGMQLINDYSGVAEAKNAITIETTHRNQNGIHLPHLMVVTMQPVAAGTEILLSVFLPGPCTCAHICMRPNLHMFTAACCGQHRHTHVCLVL